MNSITQNILQQCQKFEREASDMQEEIRLLKAEINVRIQREQHLKHFVQARIALAEPFVNGTATWERSTPELDIKIAKRTLEELDEKRHLKLEK